MRAASFKARRCLGAALGLYACLGVGSAAANSTDDAVARANRMAYEVAMRCFVADGIVSGDKREEGDKAAQAAYEAQARRSFDVAEQLGQVLGYSGTRVNQDFGLAQATELPRLMTDSAYFQRTAKTCKALGLM